MLPRGRLYLDALGVWTPTTGAAARFEAGARLTSNLGLFGFGQLDKGGPSVGGGARFTW